MGHRVHWYYPFEACLVEYERDPLLYLFDQDRTLEKGNLRIPSLEAVILELPAWSVFSDSLIYLSVSRSTLELEMPTEKSTFFIFCIDSRICEMKSTFYHILRRCAILFHRWLCFAFTIFIVIAKSIGIWQIWQGIIVNLKIILTFSIE